MGASDWRPSDDSGNGIAVDNQGSCYVTGNFSQTLRLGKVSLGAGEKPSIFTAKFSSEGKFIWANQTTASGACYGRGIGVDQYGNSYITGSVKGVLSIGGQVVNASSGSYRLPSSGIMLDMPTPSAAAARVRQTSITKVRIG
mgnify:CR=1 FL=1